MRLSLTSSIVLFISATAASASDTTAVIDERAILLELYNAVGGNAWKNNLGWAENSSDICDWHGVICNEDDLDMTARQRHQRQLQDGDSNYKVLGLSLRENFLTGRTPPSLWRLPILMEIDLSHNPQLDVSFAGLTKAASDSTPSTTTSSHLQSIKISETATTSVVGISAISDTLTTLQLSKNSFNSQIPTDIYSLTQLTSLHMAECQLLGSIPNDIHRLSLLHEFNVFANSLTGSIPQGMERLIHLRHLTLSINQFHGTIPSFVNNWVLLNELWLVDNDFTGSIPSLNRSPEMHKLYLNGNSLGGEFPQDFLDATLIGPREHTVHVNLQHNELQGTLPESLDRLSELEMELLLGDNKWTAVSPALCDNVNWNQGAVRKFDCSGLLCPPRTYAFRGYQTSDASCQPCASNPYWGATTCYDKDDHSVLVELYVALKGESWKHNDGWLSANHVCDWYGVDCWDENDSKRGRVRKVMLPNNGLQGKVPDTIWSLQHLTTIDFGYNPELVLTFEGMQQAQHVYMINIAATGTKDFDGLEYANNAFREFYLDQTPISGTIPTELFSLSSLQVLSMQECELVGEIPSDIFQMTSLQQLYLSNNRLSGVLRDRFDELSELKYLALGKNALRGSLPPSLDAALSLEALSLEDQVTKGGGLSGPILPFSTTTTLRMLRLAKNKLEGDLPDNLLAGLEGDAPVVIDLADNLFTGKIHGAWDRFQRLDLYLQGNFITEIEQRLCDQEDWLSGSVKAFGCNAILCPAGTSGGRHVYKDAPCQSCSTTTTSTLSTEYLGQVSCGQDESDIMSERDILELLYERCGGNGWHSREYWTTDESICEWYGIDCNENGSVTSIQLGSNQLVGSFPTEIYRLPNLKHLKLYSNTLYFSFDGIENAKRLQSLALDNTGLESLRGLGKARTLVQLNVAYNRLNGPIPEELGRLVNLESFDISFNNISGFLPYWLRGLASLSTFKASHNQLSGPIFDFSVFTDLIYMDLSHNQLTGSVPAKLFHTSHADEKLIADLSSNQLTGTLPGDLSYFSKLSLQVENNQISGLDSNLCTAAEGWNDNAVEQYGCDGILCPAGTWNSKGRMSNDDGPCMPCKKASYMGTTHCKSGANAATAASMTTLIVSTVAVVLSMVWL